MLGVYVVVSVVATFGLAFVPPGQPLLAAGLYVVANFAFEGAYVFYNAFLPDLAPPERVGRLSGYGWALGYVGGLLALGLCFPLVPKSYTVDAAGAASTVFLIIAVWYLVFSLPALLWLRDRPSDAAARPDGRGYLRAAFAELLATIRHVASYRAVAFFLAAYFLYNDGITTVIQFTGIYTKEVLAFGPRENVVLFLVLNVIAAPGALVFGSLVDRIGGRRTIQLTLVVWVVVVGAAATATSKVGFWPVAVLAAIVIGATQASSRALMARLAPRDRMGEFMGFLALSGKASAVMGPMLYGVVADVVGRPGDGGRGHRIAIACIGALFVVALVVLRRVDERAPERS
jgi:UMF1 family MFS transporter